MDEQVAQETPKLGFGLMRLPRRGLGIDVAQVSRMVDLFLEAGFTYFDTAHVYAGSEDAIRKALVERRPRESYTLATKLYAAMSPSAKSAKRQFETSLERTGQGLHRVSGAGPRERGARRGGWPACGVASPCGVGCRAGFCRMRALRRGLRTQFHFR